MFIGLDTPAAKPWESLHRSKSKRLFAELTLEVRDCYRAQGVVPAEYPHVADDHIALEADFLYVLGRRALESEGEARWASLAASADFLDEHLLKWVGDFAACATSYDPESLYAVAARLMDKVATRDREVLREALVVAQVA